jgi:hypothetical protein
MVLQSVGLYRSVEKRIAYPCRHAVGMPPRKTRMHSYGMPFQGVYTGFYRAMHPDGMRFYMIRYNIEYSYKKFRKLYG